MRCYGSIITALYEILRRFVVLELQPSGMNDIMVEQRQACAGQTAICIQYCFSQKREKKKGQHRVQSRFPFSPSHDEHKQAEVYHHTTVLITTTVSRERERERERGSYVVYAYETECARAGAVVLRHPILYTHWHLLAFLCT